MYHLGILNTGMNRILIIWELGAEWEVGRRDSLLEVWVVGCGVCGFRKGWVGLKGWIKGARSHP